MCMPNKGGILPASAGADIDGILADDFVEERGDMPDTHDTDHRYIFSALRALRSQVHDLKVELHTLREFMGHSAPPTTLIGLLAANPWMLAFVVLAIIALGKEVVLASLHHVGT